MHAIGLKLAGALIPAVLVGGVVLLFLKNKNLSAPAKVGIFLAIWIAVAVAMGAFR